MGYTFIIPVRSLYYDVISGISLEGINLVVQLIENLFHKNVKFTLLTHSLY